MSKRIGERAGLWALVVLAAVPLIAGPAQAAPEVRYEARVNRQTISMDDHLTLTVQLSISGGREQDLVLPQSPDFEVFSRSQSEQSAYQVGPGGFVRSRTKTYTLGLRPLREGMLTIQPGSVVVDGKKYETEPIYVRVTKGSGAHPSPSEPRVATGRQGELFVEVQLDKERAYVGEEILLSIWLYSRVDILNVTSVVFPDLDGFWIGDIANPTQLSARMQEVNGVPYRVYLLSRKAIFGLREGKLEIEPATVEVTVGGRGFSRGRTLRRSSRPLEVELLPLPPTEENLPVGGVGSFRLSSSATPASVRVGDPVTFRLMVSGHGNLPSILFPRLPEIEGMRAFEPTVTEAIDVSSGHYGGSKTREIVLIPERPGRFEIPSLPWLYFDPVTERYERLETEAFTIEVRGERGAVVATAGDERTPIRDPLRLEPPTALWRAPWFGWALALPTLLVVAALALPRLGRRGRGEAIVSAQKVLRELAAEERRDEGSWPEVLPRILFSYLSARLGRETAGLPRHELARLLEEAQVPEDEVAALFGLLEDCDRERFAPAALRGKGGGAWARARAFIEGMERR